MIFQMFLVDVVTNKWWYFWSSFSTPPWSAYNVSDISYCNLPICNLSSPCHGPLPLCHQWRGWCLIHRMTYQSHTASQWWLWNLKGEKTCLSTLGLLALGRILPLQCDSLITTSVKMSCLKLPFNLSSDVSTFLFCNGHAHILLIFPVLS